MNIKTHSAAICRCRTVVPVVLLRYALAALLCATRLDAFAEDGITELGTLGGGSTWSGGISADGSVVVGGSVVGGGYHAFRWTSGGGMVDLGTLGGSDSYASGVSADGAVVVGTADNTMWNQRAFRWTSGGGMVDLGTLGGDYSRANGVSADGSVVVGSSFTTGNATSHAFRWSGSDGMVDLGTFGGDESDALGVSADGSVVVGFATTAGNVATRAFRWTNSDGLVDLGTLGGTHSRAYGVSADGTVVVGDAYTAGDAYSHAYRWTSGGGMVDLGTLGRDHSSAYGVSADGTVVVGVVRTGAAWRAFRWTDQGMLSVEDWLRANGVTVPVDITASAAAVNADGSVVVGELASGGAFLARVSPIGSGLVSLADVQQSLLSSAGGSGTVLRSANLAINGAHSRPLARRVAIGKRAFWLAGDWARDEHGDRADDLGLAELGLGYNYGPVQLNLSLGQAWARQNLALNGWNRSDGTYLLAEALIPVSGTLWATMGGYRHWGRTDLKRGYPNAGVSDSSNATPDIDTWGLRARLDWEKAYSIAGAGLAPYVDLSHASARLDAYTETGGGFPARFDARKDKATELRFGINAAKPLDNGWRLLGTLEAAHRFEKEGSRTSGEVIGLFGFDLGGQKNRRDWLRASVGMEGKLVGGVASLSLNATTNGEMPSYWLAANWHFAF